MAAGDVRAACGRDPIVFGRLIEARNSAATYTLEATDSALVVKSPGRSDITIAPFSKDVFVGDLVGIVKFSRDAHGTVTGFTINRDIARGVWFDRIKRTG